ncbi:MAG: FAD-dependent oxidoreductase [Thermodesulfobacteriota bacterium]|nr:FAD-dependent oxidoreductase [Thermodesulfobacteriota bacterium]
MTGIKRMLIVGGVAGGASCGARARRLSEDIEIILFERGPYVSFANCGLPYYVGDVIQEEKELFLATPELFQKRFNIDVRVENEVVLIDRDKSEVEIKDLKTNTLYREPYDALVLSPGANPITPPLSGIDFPGIFTLRTVPDSRRIREWIVKNRVNTALIVGGGFIGLEMAENLVKRGISVTIVEMLQQVMPALDPEMAAHIYDHIKSCGVSLCLNQQVTGFKQGTKGGISVELESNKTIVTDMVLLALGVRPDITLAKQTGLEIGARGGIYVDDQMHTSDEKIWAVGDAVESQDFVTSEMSLIPLAGPANRQGRIAADVILGRDSRFRGIQGTAVCGIFDMTVASTGVSEKNIKRIKTTGENLNYEKVYLHPNNHAGYYPKAEAIAMKLIFSPDDGTILGAQAVGKEGVEKRIDIISMAIQMRSTVFDLEDVELCYSPQFGSAKDPVNFAGMVAANTLRGDAPIAHWEDIRDSNAIIIDVRDPDEFEDGAVQDAINIPLSELRQRIDELPRDQEIFIYCAIGQRSYYATRILHLNGFKVRNLSGGKKTYMAFEQLLSNSE